MSEEHPASREDIEVLMVHMSLLAEWRMRRTGNALGSGVAAAVLVAMIGGFAVGDAAAILAPLIGVLVTAVMLFRAEAPVPETS